MGISTQITRLQNARNTIRAKLVALGLVENTAKLDACATVISEIDNNGAVSASVKEGESYTIPAGYHNGAGTVKGIAGGGNYSLQAKNVTPTKRQQSITPDDGYYGLSAVTVGVIPAEYQNVSDVTAVEGHVLAGDIFVTKDGSVKAGTMINNGAVTESIDGLSVTSYTIPAGYHSGTGKVSLTNDIESALAAI